jgi:hypothetical protein
VAVVGVAEVVVLLVLVVDVLVVMGEVVLVVEAGTLFSAAWPRLLVAVVLVVIREGMREIRGRETGAEEEGGDRETTKECSEAE